MWLVKVYEVCPKAISYLGDARWVETQSEAKRFASKAEARKAAAEHDNGVVVRLKTKASERLRKALKEIASLAGSTTIDFGGHYDEQRAAIFNACRDALAGKDIESDNYRTKAPR